MPRAPDPRLRLRTLGILSAALPALTFAAMPATALRAQAWPIKEFEVVNVEPAGLVDGQHNIHALLAGIVRVIRGSDAIDPDFPGMFESVRLDADTKAAIETHLHESAVRLEQWGFPPPALEPIVTTDDGREAYRVYLVAGLDDATGRYHGRPCQVDGLALRLNESVALLDASAVLDNGRLTTRGTQVVGHELFHAVQWGSPFLRGCDGHVGSWMIEGQARALGWDLVRARGTLDLTGLAESVWGLRNYSDRLYVPHESDPIPESRAYETASFWRYMAEYHAASQSGAPLPGPAINPVDYEYLARLLRRDPAPRDCVAAGATCDGEVGWLDSGLRELFRERLRDLYPRFVQAFAQYGEGRFTQTGRRGLSTPEEHVMLWNALAFDHGCALVELSPPDAVTAPERPDRWSLQHTDVATRFDDLSAQCWDVHVDGFDEALVQIAVTVLGPRTAAQLAQLTAVLADGTLRLDTADVVQALAGEIPRATWYYDLPSDGETLFLLANVAHDAEATRPLPDLNVTFTALKSVASMGTQTDSRGGPSPAEIDTPLPIELSEIRNAVAVRDYTLTEGMTTPCLFTVDANDGPCADGRCNGVYMAIAHEGPIAPGVYPIAPSRRGATRTSFHRNPGAFYLDYVVDGARYYGGGGAVTITSVSGGLIRGHLEATGQGPGFEPASAPPITARFAVVVRPSTLGGRLQFNTPVRLIDPCLAEGPV